MAVITLLIISANNSKVHAKNGPCTKKNYCGAIYLNSIRQGSGRCIYRCSGGKKQKVSGYSYNKSNNTLTIKNAGKANKYGEEVRLGIQNMGDDFKIKLEGKSYIGYLELYGYKYNNKVTITGSGSLYIDTRSLGDDTNVIISGNSFVNISNTCNVYLYKNSGGAFVKTVLAKKSNKSKWFVAHGKINKKIKFKYKKKDKIFYTKVKNVYVGRNGKNTFYSKKTSKYTNPTKKSSSSNNKKTVKKKAEKKYKISYKLNGGKNSKKNPSTYTKKKLPIKLYKASKKGYKFKGWKLKGKTIKKIKKGTTGNITIEAKKWKPIKYTVYCYDGNKLIKTYKYTIKQSIGIPDTSKIGYTFLGWYETALSNIKITKIKKGSIGNRVLYARWKKLPAQTISASDFITYVNAPGSSINAKASGGGKLSYSSNNTEVATVNSNGVVSPKSTGVCKITITASATSFYSYSSKTIMVTVNSNNTYRSFNIASKLPYLNSNSLNSVMCPQGICTVGNYILISAYQYKENKDSAIYVLDKNGTYKGCIYLGNNTAHVGGIASDGKTVFVASGKRIAYFKKEIVEYLVDNGVDNYILSENNHYNYIGVSADNIQISTLTYHKNALWVAKYESKSKVFSIWAVPIAYNNGSLLWSEKIERSTTEAHGISCVNGIVFADDTSNKMFISTSKGREYYSELYCLNVTLDDLRKQCPEIKTKVKNMPPMAEGMAIINNNLVTVYESSSNLYKTPLTPDNNTPAPHPMDFLTFFRLSDMDY